MRLERSALAARSGALASTAPRSRVLCFHSVGTPLWGVNDVAPALFRRQLLRAQQHGWRFTTASEIANDPGRSGRLAVTFDDGLRSVATHALPVLEELGIPATLFVVSGWASGEHATGFEYLLDWDEVGAMQDRGVEVASHSVSHPDFGRLSASQIEHELGRSREDLQRRLGVDGNDFAIPLGQSNNWNAEAQSAARAAGYRRVWAQTEDKRTPGTLGRTFITRFDRPWVFERTLTGAFDRWQEWV